jgi:hypothetical protein
LDNAGGRAGFEHKCAPYSTASRGHTVSRLRRNTPVFAHPQRSHTKRHIRGRLLSDFASNTSVLSNDALQNNLSADALRLSRGGIESPLLRDRRRTDREHDEDGEN